MKPTVITAILGCTFILVSLHSAFGFPSETEDEAGKMSSGWGSGSGWGNAMPTNGTTASAGATVIVQNVTSSNLFDDHLIANVTSTTGDAELSTEFDHDGYNEMYFETENTTAIASPTGAQSSASYTYAEADSDSEGNTTLLVSPDAYSIYYTQSPNINSTFLATGLTLSTWASATEGINLAGNNSGDGWGWSKDETVK